MMLVSSAAFSGPKSNYPVTLHFSNGTELNTNSVKDSSTIGIPVTPEIFAHLGDMDLVTITSTGARYDFKLNGAGAAVDAVLDCAGFKNYRALMSEPPVPIAGAGDWKLVARLPGTNNCSVRVNGPEVNTSMMLNGDGELILIAGRPDWAFSGQGVKASLAIDGGPPTEEAGYVLTTIAMFKVTGAQIRQLMAATDVDWKLPWGVYHAKVNGLGVAYSALKACHAALQPKG
jgi:hypothetical protein